MRFNSLVFITLLLFGCKKGSDKYPETKLGGHACAGLESTASPYHDNSLEAFMYALSYQQIEYIEIDVCVSKDSTAWMIHDTELDQETTGSGCVTAAEDSYLQGLRYVGLKNERLVRVIDLPADLKNRTLILDLRESSSCTNGLQDSVLIASALTGVKNHFQNASIIVVASSPRLLALYNSFGWKVYLDSYNKTHFLNYPTTIPFDGMSITHENCTKEDIEELHLLGYEVMLFGARSPKLLRKALRKHSNILLVDDIKEAINEKFR